MQWGQLWKGSVVWHATNDWHVLGRKREGGRVNAESWPRKGCLTFFSHFVVNWKITVSGYSFVLTSQQSSWPGAGEKRRMEGVGDPALIGYQELAM